MAETEIATLRSIAADPRHLGAEIGFIAILHIWGQTLNTIAAREIIAVIPSNRSRSITIDYDKELYKERHLVEFLINKIKHFRRIATRCDKTVCSFIAMLFLCGTMIWLR